MTLPVSVAEAKKHLELTADDTTHDSHLQTAIEAAVEQFEHDTSLIPSTQTFELVMNRFPHDDRRIWLPYRPVTAMASALQ